MNSVSPASTSNVLECDVSDVCTSVATKEEQQIKKEERLKKNDKNEVDEIDDASLSVLLTAMKAKVQSEKYAKNESMLQCVRSIILHTIACDQPIMQFGGVLVDGCVTKALTLRNLSTSISSSTSSSSPSSSSSSSLLQTCVQAKLTSNCKAQKDCDRISNNINIDVSCNHATVNEKEVIDNDDDDDDDKTHDHDNNDSTGVASDDVGGEGDLSKGKSQNKSKRECVKWAVTLKIEPLIRDPTGNNRSLDASHRNSSNSNNKCNHSHSCSDLHDQTIVFELTDSLENNTIEACSHQFVHSLFILLSVSPYSLYFMAYNASFLLIC